MVWLALRINPYIAFSAVIGSTAFFITHGFKENAEKQERQLLKEGLSDISKILYLEVIDTTFSIDGVLGAFVVREFTIRNIERIKKYIFLKNGAMYSILCLGTIMLLDSFGIHIPPYTAPLSTFGIVAYFYYKSVKSIPAL